MENFRSGFVSIIGRTNVGKSTLINTIIGEKIAIITDKPQTTRTKIKAIVNRPNSQIIFIDTPGVHKPKTKFSESLLEVTYDSLNEADVVVFITESTSMEIGKGDMYILEKLKKANKKVILVINKIDLIKKELLLEIIEKYSKEYDFEAIIPISALKNKGIEDILIEIETLLPYGPKYYDKEEYTDQTLRQLVEETVREKALKLLNDEVPHGIYVETEKMKIGKTKLDEKIYNIEEVIYCTRESHKGIIIGKNGEMLKRIGKYSRQDLEKMLEMKVNLKLWVKVKKDWQEDDKLLKKFKVNV